MIDNDAFQDLDPLDDDRSAGILIITSPLRPDGTSAGDNPDAMRRLIQQACWEGSVEAAPDALPSIGDGTIPRSEFVRLAEKLLRLRRPQSAVPVRAYAVDIQGRVLAHLDLPGDAATEEE